MISVKNKRTYSGPGIYIGRPSVLGNPFPMKDESERAGVVEKYREWLREQYRLKGEVRHELDRLVRLNKESKDIVLICWCAPLPCHGDVIKDAIEKLSK